jgi:TolB protein
LIARFRAAQRAEQPSQPRPRDIPTDELPWVTLEPPPEAGDVVRLQMDMPTRPGTLPPIELDILPPEPPSVLVQEIEKARPRQRVSPPAKPPIEPPPPAEAEPPASAPVVEAAPQAEPPASAPIVEAAPQAEPPTPTPEAKAPPLPPEQPIMRLPALKLEDEEEESPPQAPASAPKAASPPPAEEEEAFEEEEEEEEEEEGEIVDAEWVIEVGERLMRERQPQAARREPASAAPSGRWEALRGVLSDRRLLWLIVPAAVLVLAVAGVGVAVLASRARPAQPGGETPPAGLPGESLTPAAPSPPADTPPAVLTAAQSTPLPPYAQGRIAFASNSDGDFEIYVLDMVTGQMTQLTDNTASDRSPVWSPDGRLIVFSSDRSGDDDLFVMNAACPTLPGGCEANAIQLTSDGAMDRFPAWSPDGGTIVFSRETVNGSDLMSFPTTCLHQAGLCEDMLSAVTSGRYDRDPHWSPDGLTLAYSSADFPGLPSAIALLSPLSRQVTRLSGTGSSDFYPVWSPEGARLAFVSYAQGDYDLWVMSPSGGNVTQLTFDVANDIEPAWSPDGAFIVFASDRDSEGDFELYLIAPTCTSPEQGCESALIRLTNNSADDLNPAWTR